MNISLSDIVSFSATGLIVLFVYLGIMVTAYLITMHRLKRKIKADEPDLWDTLGHPNVLSLQSMSSDLFKDLSTQMVFSKWILSGGIGAKKQDTRLLIRKVRQFRKLYIAGTIAFVILFCVTFIYTIFTN